MAELQITLDIMLPVFILLALGWLLCRIGLMPGDLPGRLNKLIFSLFLPVMLFPYPKAYPYADEQTCILLQYPSLYTPLLHICSGL